MEREIGLLGLAKNTLSQFTWEIESVYAGYTVSFCAGYPEWCHECVALLYDFITVVSSRGCAWL